MVILTIITATMINAQSYTVYFDLFYSILIYYYLLLHASVYTITDPYVLILYQIILCTVYYYLLV